MPLTATTSMARRIDRAEAAMVVDMAEASRTAGAHEVRTWRIGGGAAVLGEPGSPSNKVIGVGFGSPASEAEWQDLERVHAERGARVQVECSSMADPSVAEMLTARGYRLVGFENVLARHLDEVERAADGGGTTMTPVGSAEASLWIDTMIEGFLHPDRSDGPPAHEAFDRDVLARAYEVFGDVPGVERVLASHGGATAGGASMCFRDGIALLCGAATLPALRRRGVQSALLRARLARAREGGCELAVVTTQPGSKSQQNVQRSGFELLYTRAILVWDPRSFLRTAD